MPVSLVVASQDRAVPPAQARQALALLRSAPGSLLNEWQGLGHLAHEEQPQRAADFACGAGILATAALVVFGEEGGWRGTSTFGWPLNAIVLAAVATSLAKSGVFARLFSMRWVAATGTISYGIYLWHDLIQRAVFSGTLRGNFTGFPLFLAGGAIALVVSIFVATLSWHIIEKGTLRASYPLAR